MRSPARVALYVGGIAALAACLIGADDNIPLGDRARQYLTDLIKLDTTNPPGNETVAAQYLKQVADAHGIPCELVGGEPRRLNFLARLKGSGKGRPLLLVAHTDVVPVERSQWTADPLGAELRNGFIYGRGSHDAKGLVAAELAVLVEIKRRNIKLGRDIILLAEADEEAGSLGMQWVLQHAPNKIDAEFALNEGGFVLDKAGQHIFQIQTAEKIPMRVTLTAKGVPGHASLPRPDNPVLRLARAVTKLADAEQPVRLNSTSRRYLQNLIKLDDYAWLAPLVPKLENPVTSGPAANLIRVKDPEIEAMLRTTVSPTMLRAGVKINVIPGVAEAQFDVRRLPNETREEVIGRFRQIINDTAIEVNALPQIMPSTEPSSLNTPLYRAMEKVIGKLNPRDLVLPFMTRGSTDGSFLRSRGTPVYGVPLFVRDGGEPHGNDERIATQNLESGVELLWQIILEVAGAD